MMTKLESNSINYALVFVLKVIGIGSGVKDLRTSVS